MQAVVRGCSILTLFEVMHRAPTDEVSYSKAFPLHAKQHRQDETFGRHWLPKLSGGVIPISQHLIFEKFYHVAARILKSKLCLVVFHHHQIIHVTITILCAVIQVDTKNGNF